MEPYFILKLVTLFGAQIGSAINLTRDPRQKVISSPKPFLASDVKLDGGEIKPVPNLQPPHKRCGRRIIKTKDFACITTVAWIIARSSNIAIE